MSTIILVHGAWHGAWCWNKVVPILERYGHHIITPTLPGHNESGMVSKDVSLDDYVTCIASIINEQTETVVLVGHSMSGIVISMVADLMPDKVRKLIYITAFLLNDGESLLDITQLDAKGMVLPNLDYSRDRKTAKVKDAIIVDAFYHDCSDDDIAFARSRVVSQALSPLSTPVTIHDDQWGRVSKSYIECTGDNAISISIQRRMWQNSGCEKVITMHTGHSPFFSAPETLAKNIDLICQ